MKHPQDLPDYFTQKKDRKNVFKNCKALKGISKQTKSNIFRAVSKFLDNPLMEHLASFGFPSLPFTLLHGADLIRNIPSYVLEATFKDMIHFSPDFTKDTDCSQKSLLEDEFFRSKLDKLNFICGKTDSYRPSYFKDKVKVPSFRLYVLLYDEYSADYIRGLFFLEQTSS